MKADAGLQTAGLLFFLLHDLDLAGQLITYEAKSQLENVPEAGLSGSALQSRTQSSGKPLLSHQGEGSSQGCSLKG